MSTISEAAGFAPEWGIVLGSGLGVFVDDVEVVGRLPFSDIPGLPPSRVAGHAGEFAWGWLGGRRLLMSRGRVHLYEGHSGQDVTAGIRWMAECGVRRVILTNAAGTLNPAYPPANWMMLTDHLNLTGTSPLIGGPNFVDMTEIYSLKLRDHFRRSAHEVNMELHEGVYAGLVGPQYETPAEIRMLARLGADAVGMSTVLEAIQARALGLEVAGFSCLTNWAAGISAQPLNHGEVLTTGKAVARQFCALVKRAVAAYS